MLTNIIGQPNYQVIIMFLKAIKEEYKQIPAPVKVFVIRALVILLGWNLLYHLWLLPIQVPDRQLTNITVYSTKFFLSFFYDHAAVVMDNYKPIITINGHKIVGIARNCNGLELMVLYVGFILCFPSDKKRMLNFILWGLVLIFIINILRCAAIAWLNINYKHWVDFGHKIAFKVTMYSLIFYIWVRYTKNYFNILKRKEA